MKRHAGPTALRDTLKPAAAAVAIALGIILLALISDPRVADSSINRQEIVAPRDHHREASVPTEITVNGDGGKVLPVYYARTRYPVISGAQVPRNYRTDVFLRDPAKALCEQFTAAVHTELNKYGGMVPDSWMLPATNHSLNMITRCFSSNMDGAPSAGDSACERDLLGLPWPVLTREGIAEARSGDRPSIAVPAPRETVRDSLVGRARRAALAAKGGEPRVRPPLSNTGFPDFFASREHLERHRFWRTVGRAGIQEAERPKLLVDVSPNGGHVALLATLYGFEVLALEPIPVLAEALREAECANSFLTTSARITIVNFTAGSYDNTCALPVDREDPSCFSSLSVPMALQRSPERGPPLSVRHRRIDDLHLPYVTMVKVDAGVRTISVLLGMSDTLRWGGVADTSVVSDDQAGDSPAEREDTDAQRFPVSVILVRVPLECVVEVVSLLWDYGMVPYWRDLGRGTLDTPSAVADAMAKSRSFGGAATGMHIFARPRERVDVLDHTAALRAALLAEIGD